MSTTHTANIYFGWHFCELPKGFEPEESVLEFNNKDVEITYKWQEEVFGVELKSVDYACCIDLDKLKEQCTDELAEYMMQEFGTTKKPSFILCTGSY